MFRGSTPVIRFSCSPQCLNKLSTAAIIIAAMYVMWHGSEKVFLAPSNMRIAAKIYNYLFRCAIKPFAIYLLLLLPCSHDSRCHVSKDNKYCKNQESLNWNKKRGNPAAADCISYFFVAEVEEVVVLLFSLF
jgi:hypothetical protein